MSSDSSPIRFSGVPDYEYDVHFDPQFTADISNKMQVPKNIRIGGDDGSDTDDVNRNWNRTNAYQDKFDMQVPDRIMVRGQDQHVGTKALPRELQLQGTDAMITDPSIIRILTPPRTITLLDQPKYNYGNKNENDKHENDDDMLVVQNNRARLSSMMSNVMPNGNIGDGIFETSNDVGGRNAALEASGFYDAEVQSELDHFRDQFKRLANRITMCEAEIKERKEREQYIMLVGGAYLALQILKWLFKTNPR